MAGIKIKMGLRLFLFLYDLILVFVRFSVGIFYFLFPGASNSCLHIPKTNVNNCSFYFNYCN